MINHTTQNAKIKDVVRRIYGFYLFRVCMHFSLSLSIDSIQQLKRFWDGTVPWKYVLFIWVVCSMQKKRSKWHQQWQILLANYKDSYITEIGIVNHLFLSLHRHFISESDFFAKKMESIELVSSSKCQVNNSPIKHMKWINRFVHFVSFRPLI